MTQMKRNTTIAALAVVVALGFAACGGDDEEPAASGSGAATTATATSDAVTIDTFSFGPNPLTVPVGTTVTFTNKDDVLHTVTAGLRDAPSGEFDEQLDGAGATAKVTFDKPGTIDYFCEPHQGMDGQVIVE